MAANRSSRAFDAEAFLALIHRHVQAEIAGDVDAVMATICTEPHYEVHPIGFIMKSSEAVRAFYRRALPMFTEIKPDSDSATWESGNAGKFVGARGVVVRDVGIMIRNGHRTPIKALAMFIPDPASGLLKGEHIYTNSATAKVFSEKLGADFIHLPGVTQE